MHTTKVSDEVTYIHDGDMKGRVFLVVPLTLVTSAPAAPGDVRLCHVQINAEDLLAFAAERVRSERIAKLEQAAHLDHSGPSEWDRATCLAAAIVVRTFDQPYMARTILSANGIDHATLELPEAAGGIAEYDATVLRPLFTEAGRAEVTSCSGEG